MRHGVVFGGGGVLGISWEIGVLAGLADAGIDPVGGASAIVGTSAGSVVGARLAGGAEIAALEADELAPAGDSTGATGQVFAMLDYQLLADTFSRWTGSWPMTEDVAREVGELSLKQTTLDESTFAALIEAGLGGAAWPRGDLSVVTSSCDTGKRTVWTREDGVPLDRALAASCAIPGILPPITVDPSSAERYVDGGVWSGTNADLLLDDGLDAVLVIEPLSASTNQLGDLSTRSLAAEVAALEAKGTVVHAVSADAAYGAFSTDLLDPAKRPEALALGRATGTTAAPAVAALLGVD